MFVDAHLGCLLQAVVCLLSLGCITPPLQPQMVVDEVVDEVVVVDEGADAVVAVDEGVIVALARGPCLLRRDLTRLTADGQPMLYW